MVIILIMKKKIKVAKSSELPLIYSNREKKIEIDDNYFMEKNTEYIKKIEDVDKEIKIFDKKINAKKFQILEENENLEKKKELYNEQIKEEDNKNRLLNIQIEEPVKGKNNSLKYLPADEYFKLTVQKALEQGLLNIAMVHPTDPIRFLGNYLIEKSKSSSIV